MRIGPHFKLIRGIIILACHSHLFFQEAALSQWDAGRPPVPGINLTVAAGEANASNASMLLQLQVCPWPLSRLGQAIPCTGRQHWDTLQKAGLCPSRLANNPRHWVVGVYCLLLV
jgi:hypothetical protein